MKRAFCTFALILAPAAPAFLAAGDEPSVDGMEVLKVEPSNRIRHGVELKGVLGEERGFCRLSGPSHFSQAVRIGQGSLAATDVFLTWYEIAKSKAEPDRKAKIHDSLRGKDVYSITLGQPKYLLSPAQRITTGAPAKVPEWLGLYKVYEITSADQFDERSVLVSGDFPAEDRNVSKPILLCVPTAQWHHEEHMSIDDKDRAIVVYQLNQRKQASQISTIDQFGLNQLSVQSSDWLCVPATIE